MSHSVSIKEMPHDLLTEKSLLGCLLIDSHCFDLISESGLEETDFYDPKYQSIFKAIKDLYYENVAIDYVSVCAKLRDSGKLEQVGGQGYILELIEDQASTVHVTHYAKIVKEKSIVREIIRTASRVIETGTKFTGTVADFISEVEANFFKLTSQTRSGGLRDLKTFLKHNLKELENVNRKKGEISGLPTGFVDLDRALLGLQPGQLVVLAARPGVGKTSLAISVAVNSVKHTGLPVAVFSLEMLAPELSMRILSSQACVDSERLRTKNFLDSDLRNIAHAVQELSHAPLYINDAADVNLLDIKSQCRKIKLEQGLGLVVIDYLQLMQSHNKVISREQQISEISRGLKNLAKELECPIIALSQLNRAVESRPDKRPLISDLRESGSIEQDADIVLMIYRDDMYNPESKEKGIAEVIIAKNRAGSRGTVKLAWIGSQTKFAPLSQNYAGGTQTATPQASKRSDAGAPSPSP
ncbi:MAG: replicative DNA helicase [Halobacteriovoraceae bacterium]|nr:replicative DNA helicase [Halobacteriovoraceae bacterium]MCB9093955.1 replicative DNA helicase [Halobacteriovoraceae bacterium]